MVFDFFICLFLFSILIILKNVYLFIYKIKIVKIVYVKLKINVIIVRWLLGWCCDFEKIWNGSSIVLMYICKFYLCKINYWWVSMICIGLFLKGWISIVNK